MTTEPDKQPDGEGASAVLPAIVEDLFMTEDFLIKGRIANKHRRLTQMLEDNERTFLEIEEATLVSLRGHEVLNTPSVMVNRSEIIFAHELIDTAGDEGLKQLSTNAKTTKVRAFYSGAVQLELSGRIAPSAYEPSHNAGKWYFIMEYPTVRGIDLEANPHFEVLKALPYVIVRKSKLAYIYDFG